ncbi:SET domain-containing protein [Trichodelitschia bisporula]|uniref:SET domain-containing protein n=1 Tax=Trichodelitschia bisporula TaxID=703511 RepID=A0A6G1I2W0_9PEZI|nr:SET domain-containing protein [Trichodelitschia bisporula]
MPEKAMSYNDRRCFHNLIYLVDSGDTHAAEWPTGKLQDELSLHSGPDSSYDEPWSSRSRCLRFQNSTERYCVYTSTTFAGGRGISVFTTPERAAQIARLPAFTDPEVLHGVNHEPNPPYEARTLPGRGIGLIANRTLHRGDHIFSNTPVLLVQESISEDFFLKDHGPFHAEAVERLPERSRAAFMNLCGHFGGDPVQDIINTNSFEVVMFDDEDDVPFNMVVSEISRLNHACRPNAHYVFDNTTLTHRVHALRTIQPGEELTISYIDPVLPRAVRLESLKHSWGFKCSCKHCRLPDDEAAISDARIARIQNLTEELKNYESTARASPESAVELVDLYEEERLWAPIAEAYTLAALEWNGDGNVGTARVFAKAAVESGLLYGGRADDDVREMERLVEDPTTHWSWGLRGRTRIKGDIPE